RACRSRIFDARVSTRGVSTMGIDELRSGTDVPNAALDRWPLFVFLEAEAAEVFEGPTVVEAGSVRLVLARADLEHGSAECRAVFAADVAAPEPSDWAMLFRFCVRGPRLGEAARDGVPFRGFGVTLGQGH